MISIVALGAWPLEATVLPSTRNVLTAWMSCTSVTMLLANTRISAMMLRMRTPLRPMKISVLAQK
jgi:hypothetical protein